MYWIVEIQVHKDQYKKEKFGAKNTKTEKKRRNFKVG